MKKQEYYAILLKEAKCTDVNKCLLKNSFETGNYNNNSINSFVYDFQYLPEYDELNELFPLNKIARNGNTFDKAVNIMNWLASKTDYNGYSKLGMESPVNIIDFSFDKGFDGAINCVNKAILLSDCLLSIGIYALPVWINNRIYSKDNEEYGRGVSHVVVHIFIDEFNKWVMFDPSFNSYLEDVNGNILNLIEIAELYKTKQQIQIKQYELNGDKNQFKEYYLEQFIFKSLLAISILKGNSFQNRDFDLLYYLLPVKPEDYFGEYFEIFNSRIINVDDFLRFPPMKL